MRARIRTTNARNRYSVALIGELLGAPAIRWRIDTGTWLTRYFMRVTRTSASIVSPRYSAGYQAAKNSISRRLHILNPEVVSVSRVPASREITADSTTIAHLRGP